jgi:hypothetical protein
MEGKGDGVVETQSGLWAAKHLPLAPHESFMNSLAASSRECSDKSNAGQFCHFGVILDKRLMAPL